MRQLLYFFIITSGFSTIAQTDAVPLASNRPLSKKETAHLDSQDVRYLPLFGSKKILQEQLVKNADFISQCETNFTTKADASKFFAERGWEYLGEGLLDTATYRFNLAYLLDTENMDVFWGLGSISYQKNNFEQSAALLRKGLQLSPDNVALMVDVATVQIACFKEKRDCNDIDDALSLLEKSVKMDSTNANAWLKYSIAEFQLEHFDKAWEYLHRCRALDLSFVDLHFVQELIAKKEDPMGMFK